jgi:hypothetical protein
MENVVIFYHHLECFTHAWYNLCPFGIVCGQLVYFPVLVCLDQIIWQSCSGTEFCWLGSKDRVCLFFFPGTSVRPNWLTHRERTTSCLQQVCQMLYFPTKYLNFDTFWRGLGLENIGIFYGHWKHFTDIWYILWLFGNVVVIWYIFPVLEYCVKKTLATLVCSLLRDKDQWGF